MSEGSQSFVAWAHNPGQMFVKDTLSLVGGKRSETSPYPSVIAPWERADDIGIGRSSTLEAVVNGARYLGGVKAARLPEAVRQMSDGRLLDDSPMYNAFAQMSWQHAKLGKLSPDTGVVVATALPVGWRTEDASASIERHIRAGLKGKAQIKQVYVRSEPSAVIYHELLNDDGGIQRDQQILMKGVVCVADIGGSTLNRAVLESIEALPGQSQSPLLGSRRAIERLMERDGSSFVDAEKRLRAAAMSPGTDGPADLILRQYQEAVIAELQQSWSIHRPVAYLFAGGTVLWMQPAIKKAFGAKARIIDKPQQAIATGLWRYAKMKIARGLK